MRILGWKRVVALVLVAACYGSTIPAFASTDDSGKTEPPAKRVSAKVDAPAPLTERERWLLDRVEELEKRVADLESKGNPTSVPGRDASAVQPSSANSASPAIVAIPPSVAPGTNSANSGSPSADPAAAVGTQATEKGKS